MTRKLIGITDYAKHHLFNEDLVELKLFIGLNFEKTDEVSDVGGILYEAPNGELFNEIFLILK